MKILVVEDESYLRRMIVSYLSEEGHEVDYSTEGNAAFNKMGMKSFDLVISDVVMNKCDGFELLRRIKEKYGKKVFVVLMTGKISSEETKEYEKKALEMGAFDYIRKPSEPDILNTIIKRVYKNIKLSLFNKHVKGVYNKFVEEYGTVTRKEQEMQKVALETVGVSTPFLYSKRIKEIYREADKIYEENNLPIFISGEEGTGRETLAKYIHYKSNIRKLPFISLDCYKFRRKELDCELFGRDASMNKNVRLRGCMERSEGGTLVIRDAEFMTERVQKKLYNAIMHKTFDTIRGVLPRSFNTRVILISSCTPNELLRRKSTYKKLFKLFLKNQILLPPLRKRKNEITPLARAFLEVNKAEFKKTIPTDLSLEAIQLINTYPWPGNVMELKNAIGKAVLLSKNECLLVDDLDLIELFKQEKVEDKLCKTKEGNISSKIHIADIPESGISIDDVVLKYVYQAMVITKYNKKKASELLGITQWALNRKWQKAKKRFKIKMSK
ncbi:MAG: sigma-54-dependent Fis family transcriptional regulator [Nitrospinae bacterium]|nr:sigma-54-dependent Fis family transcriptional regulator [Nitrospinota bacterium]